MHTEGHECHQRFHTVKMQHNLEKKKSSETEDINEHLKILLQILTGATTMEVNVKRIKKNLKK